MSSLVLAIAGLACVVGCYYLHHRRSKRFSSLPPGPRGPPILGSYMELSQAASYHELFAQWGEQYGPLVFASALGRSVLIVNDEKIATDLLVKRGTMYSDRPQFFVAGHLVGFDKFTGLVDYGSTEFKLHRKLISAAIGTNIRAKRHSHVTSRAVNMFLLRALDNSVKLEDNILLTLASTMLAITYDHDATSLSDSLIRCNEKTLRLFKQIATPGAFFADVFPFLRYLPSFTPCATYKTQVFDWARLTEEFALHPLREMERKMASGEFVDCIAAEHLANDKLSEEEKNALGRCFASMFTAGVDAPWSAIQWFFVWMLRYPHVLAKAQKEVDSIIGTGRLAEIEDRDELPYVNAIIKEVMRMSVISPVGVPHRVNQDDEYNGFFIPKDTLIMTNTWLMLRNPDVYTDPDTFNPDRFMGTNPQPDPSIAFGFGRRACPGKYLADTNMFIFLVRVIAVLNIQPVLDKQGNSVPIPSGLVCERNTMSPEPFPCHLSVRNLKLLSLVRQSLDL